MAGRGGGKLLTALLSAPIPHLLRRRRPPQLRRLFAAASGIPQLRRLTPAAVIAAGGKRGLLHTHAARFTAGGAVSDDHNQAYAWPGPEWSAFLQLLASRGYFDRVGAEGGDFAPSAQGLPSQFLREAAACLLFAADRPELLRSLSRENIEVVVDNATASLFVNSVDTAYRMRSYLANNDVNVLESEKARTLDLMRYLLTYAANHLLPSHEGNIGNKNIVHLSVGNIINELIGLFRSSEGFSFSESFSMQPRAVQSPGSYSQPIQMKPGDWLCPKCNFMNFARNVICLECKVDRPPRTLTGREWDCPQCNFMNYGRNTVCLRCDCRRPGESLSAPSAFSGAEFSKRSDATQPPTGNNFDRIEIEKRLAANDEKAERWFSKMSQMDGVSDMSNAIDDEDFPEIMPLRKGVNRFVVSTRKTPLERRLANAQYRKNLGNGGSSEADGSNTPGSSISDNLDRILGRVRQGSEKDNLSLQNVNASSPSENVKDETNASRFGQRVGNQRNDDDYVPFVPFPPNMFAQNQSGENDVSGGASTVADDDFPDVMPMQKGENRFVVGKNKSDSVRLPKYNRRLALESANSSSPAPFVPFPPDYFAKKDPQPEAGEPTSKAESSNISQSTLPIQTNIPHQSTDDKETSTPNVRNNYSKGVTDENQVTNKPYQNSIYVPKNEGGTGDNVGLGSSLTNAECSNDQPIPQPSGNSPQYGKINSENRGFTGKSLEGSAVTEPDPLDMSEEGKAARWFRRVQNITDISELANIPDEDFPSIMPMRKGVNRFVVSKRKTPLERRLTSPKYRRDLPIYNSESKPMYPPDNEGSN